MEYGAIPAHFTSRPILGSSYGSQLCSNWRIIIGLVPLLIGETLAQCPPTSDFSPEMKYLEIPSWRPAPRPAWECTGPHQTFQTSCAPKLALPVSPQCDAALKNPQLNLPYNPPHNLPYNLPYNFPIICDACEMGWVPWRVPSNDSAEKCPAHGVVKYIAFKDPVRKLHVNFM